MQDFVLKGNFWSVSSIGSSRITQGMPGEKRVQKEDKGRQRLGKGFLFSLEALLDKCCLPSGAARIRKLTGPSTSTFLSPTLYILTDLVTWQCG